MPLSTIILAFGLMNLLMGIQAYVSTGSLPSLYAAGGIGILILLSTLLKEKPMVMYIVAILASLILLRKFIPTYLHHTNKIYPDLLVILSSSFVLINILIHLYSKKISI